MNPFKNLFNKQETEKPTEHKNYVPENFEGISDAQFEHFIGMFNPGKNSLLTTIGKQEFMESVKGFLERGEKTKEEILQDMKDLSGNEFYKKYKSSENITIETMTDLYNAYGVVREGVSLSDDNKKIIVSDDLEKEGWRAQYTFQENSDVKYILEEINSKKLLYEIKIAIVKDEPFKHIRCLLLKEKQL